MPAVFQPFGNWRELGYDGGDIPGDPAVLQQIIDDFTYLRDVAWSVYQGLDSFLASALAGGFEGATADALRGVISGRVKMFVYNIARSFSLAGEAVAEYRLVLVRAQQAVAQAEGMTAGDPNLAGLKSQVSSQLARVRDAEAVMVRALEDASEMVSQPVKVPSLFERIWKGVEMTLMVAAMVVGLLSSVVTGPLGEIAFGLAATGFAMAAADYAMGRTNWKGLLLSAVGMLLPGGKGIWSMEEVGAGLRAFLGGAKQTTADVLATPSKLVPLLASGLVRGGQVLARVPGLLVDAAKALPSWIAQDFAYVRKWYPGLMNGAGAHFGYAVVNLGRFAGALFTPLSFDEIAALGFRGAWAAARQRASWTAAARAFRAGWTGYGVRATHAALDVRQMLHSMRPFLPDGAKAGPGMVPRPGKWPDPDGWLREPVVVPVPPGMPDDPAPGLIFVHSDSGRLLMGVPTPGLGRGLETLGTPAVSRLWVPEGGAPEPVRETLPPVDRVGTAGPAGGTGLRETVVPATVTLKEQKIAQDGEDGLLTTHGGLLVPVEGVLPPENLQVLRELDPKGVERLLTGNFETAVGPEGLTIHLDSTAPVPHQETPVPTADHQVIAPVTTGLDAWQTLDLLRPETAGPGQAELHTTTEELHTMGINPDHLDIAIQMMFHQATPSSVQHVTLPAVETGVVREGELGPVLHGVPQVDDARQALAEHLRAPQGGGEREFTVTPVEGGHEVVHRPTGLVTRFRGEAHEIAYHEAFLGFGPSELRRLKAAVDYIRQNDGDIVRRYELLGDRQSADRFTIRQAPRDLRQGHMAEFSIRDNESGLWLHYLADGRAIAKDQPLADGLGYLRSEMFRPDGEPRLLGVDGAPSELPLRAQRLEGDAVALVSITPDAAPLERIVVDSATGRVLEETIPARRADGGLSGEYWRFDEVGGSAVRIDDIGREIGPRFELESTIGRSSVETTGHASVEQAEASSRPAWDVGPDVDLDHAYGPLVGPKHLKDQEKGADGLLKLNPLWYRLGDFEPALLERTGGQWQYSVDATGEILIGSESAKTVVTEQEWQRLVEGMRHVTPEVNVDALRDALDGQGHPTVVVGFDESGRLTARPASRVSGELLWNQDKDQWEINDKSGRYMRPKVRPVLARADVVRWVENVAVRMSARFGREVTPGLLKYGEGQPAEAPP